LMKSDMISFQIGLDELPAVNDTEQTGRANAEPN
jgi:hypothetical protein